MQEPKRLYRRYRRQGIPFPFALLWSAGRSALGLSDNGSSVTAIGNDYSYDLTSARQIEAFGSAGDVAIGFSTSGSSPSVLNALRISRARGMFAAAFTGSRGSTMARLADVAVMVPSGSTARIQEGYMLYGHIMCELVEGEIFGRNAGGG